VGVTDESQERAPSEEELRAHLEEELRKVSVRDVLLQTIVTLVNLGGQRLGLGEGGEGRDLEQVRLAIESVRALLPLVEDSDEGAQQVRPIRDALSQLQLVYAREVSAGEGAPSHPEPGPEPAADPRRSSPGPPRDKGGLWVPPGSGT
jgi:hypothetical protein